jgi:hypothetical protein
VAYTGEFSDAILFLFFLLICRKLRTGRILVRQLKRLESPAS